MVGLAINRAGDFNLGVYGHPTAHPSTPDTLLCHSQLGTRLLIPVPRWAGANKTHAWPSEDLSSLHISETGKSGNDTSHTSHIRVNFSMVTLRGTFLCVVGFWALTLGKTWKLLVLEFPFLECKYNNSIHLIEMLCQLNKPINEKYLDKVHSTYHIKMMSMVLNVRPWESFTFLRKGQLGTQYSTVTNRSENLNIPRHFEHLKSLYNLQGEDWTSDIQGSFQFLGSGIHEPSSIQLDIQLGSVLQGNFTWDAGYMERWMRHGDSYHLGIHS